MEKHLSDRWQQINTEALVEAAISGNGDPELLQEVKELMEETINQTDRTGSIIA